jgi:hypothetical protein
MNRRVLLNCEKHSRARQQTRERAARRRPRGEDPEREDAGETTPEKPERAKERVPQRGDFPGGQNERGAGAQRTDRTRQPLRQPHLRRI